MAGLQFDCTRYKEKHILLFGRIQSSQTEDQPYSDTSSSSKVSKCQCSLAHNLYCLDQRILNLQGKYNCTAGLLFGWIGFDQTSKSVII